MDNNGIALTQKGMFVGIGSWSFGWVTSVDWIAFVGAAVLVGSFLVNWIYRSRADRREQERHVLEMDALRRGNKK